MNRFDAYEVSPVLESDIDGMGGMHCEAFPCLADAQHALTDARAEGLEARILWTLYGRTEGEGAEAIHDFETEADAFTLLCQITGIAGEPGRTVYELAVRGSVVLWTCTSDTDYGMETSVHNNEHDAQTELLERAGKGLSDEETARGKALLASGKEHDGYEAFGDFIENVCRDMLDTFSVEPHTLQL